MFELIRRIRLYNHRCPYCNTRLWDYGWQDSPIPVAVMSSVAVCPERHYAATSITVQGKQTHVFDEGGKPLSMLADLETLPPPDSDKPTHGKDVVVRTRSSQTIARLQAAKEEAARVAAKAAEEKAAAAKAAAEKAAAEAAAQLASEKPAEA